MQVCECEYVCVYIYIYIYIYSPLSDFDDIWYRQEDFCYRPIIVCLINFDRLLDTENGVEKFLQNASTIYQSASSYFPEDFNNHHHRCENPKTWKS